MHTHTCTTTHIHAQEHGDLPPLTAAVLEQHEAVVLGMTEGVVAVDTDGVGNYSQTGTKEHTECRYAYIRHR